MGNKKRISLKRERTFCGNQWNKTPTLEDENVKHALEKVDNNSNAENYIKKEFEELSDDNLLRK